MDAYYGNPDIASPSCGGFVALLLRSRARFAPPLLVFVGHRLTGATGAGFGFWPRGESVGGAVGGHASIFSAPDAVFMIGRRACQA